MSDCKAVRDPARLALLSLVGSPFPMSLGRRVGPPDSDGLLGRGGGPVASPLSWRIGKVRDRLSCMVLGGCLVSF